MPYASIELKTIVRFTSGSTVPDWGVRYQILPSLGYSTQYGGDPILYWEVYGSDRTTGPSSFLQIQGVDSKSDYTYDYIRPGALLKGATLGFYTLPWTYSYGSLLSPSPRTTPDASLRVGFGDLVVIGSENGDIWLPGDGALGYGANDLILGMGGDDTLAGGAGNDTIDGGNGTDSAVYSATAANYVISPTATGWTVTDTRSGANDGIDTLTSVERLVFTDKTINLFLSDTAIVNAAVSNVLRAPSTFGDYSMKVANGLLTLPSAQAQIVAAAATTTSVATLSYEFFTGKIPSAAGLDYLVSPTGPNPNNLNSTYYQSFNLENRYINFAVNLGRDGEGKASFAAAYGALSLLDATKAAYLKIFGSTPTDAKAHALIDSRVDYFSYYGQDGATGQGTKAAMVGWLLAEAVKADVGMYAKSNDAFLTDLLDGAAYSVDLIGVYGQASFAYAG